MNEKIAEYQNERDVNGLTDAEPSQATGCDALTALMRALLFAHHTSWGQPLSVEKLRAAAQSAEHKAPKMAKLVASARGAFAESFGLEMAAVTRGGEDTAVKGYVLRSLLPACLVRHYVQDKAEDPLRGKCLLVLALLHLNSNKMGETDLRRHLAMLGQQEAEVDAMLKRLEALKYLQSRQHAPTDAEPEKMIEPGGAAKLLGEGAIEAFIKTQMEARMVVDLTQEDGGAVEDRDGPEVKPERGADDTAVSSQEL